MDRTGAERARRVAVVWCPDWPVTAATAATPGLAEEPVAVLASGQVLACSAAARAEGVQRGLRQREAQSRCPGLVVLAHDPDQEARAFEPVVAAVERSCPGVEILRPGLVVTAARGPARYYGGEPAVIARLAGTVPVPCRVGIADGALAAILIARDTAESPDRLGGIIPAGESPEFLAGRSVDVLDRPELAGLLHRLGVRTLGGFGTLPARDVLGRFGPDGALAHRLARGLDTRPLAVRSPPPGLAVEQAFDPPVDRVDTAAFAARTLAVRFHDRLAAHGLGCDRLAIVARTENGEEHTRLWRHDGVLSAAAVADRVRWQLDGWLTPQPGRAAPSAGITLLTLVPDQVLPHAGQQLGLWGGTGAADERADRALTRVQGLLGPAAVVTPVLAGGRGPGDAVELVPWGEPRAPARDPDQPWPGRLPAPSPATVLSARRPAHVVDVDGAPVGVTGRAAVTAPPATLFLDDTATDVVAWAGPWPADERWWTGDRGRPASRRARFQLVTTDGLARLLAVEDGRWWLEAVYD